MKKKYTAFIDWSFNIITIIMIISSHDLQKEKDLKYYLHLYFNFLVWLQQYYKLLMYS